LDEARTKLGSAGVVNAAREAEWLLEHAAGLDRSDLVARDPDLDSDVAGTMAALVDRRATGEPIQYITGVAGFRHLELAVGPGVFIPRPETELVAERAMDHLPRDGVLVDVGTGSGAIALSVAQERTDARVLATERSPDALRWAAKNRDALELDVRLVECDLLDGLPGDVARKVDVVVANMPYVPVEDAEFLPADVVAHEPSLALFGDRGGLAQVERVVAAAREWLSPGGWIVLEIGHRQGERVAALLARHGYTDERVDDDLTGRERIAEGRWPGGG
jgi:release factor glutamine methyltransferase